jgi:hypothetical protein
MARFVQMIATINAGESLSSVIDCGTGSPAFIHMPDEWTPSRMSFQVSPDGANFKNLFDSNAREIAFNVRAGSSMALETGWTPILYLKVRSGTCDLPVPQEAERQISITIDTSTQVP